MTFLLVHSPVGADSRVCPNICGLYSENTRNTEKHENIHGSFAAYSCPFALNENHEKEQRHHHSVPPLSGLFGQASSLSLRADTGVCPYALPQGYSKPPRSSGRHGGYFRADTGVCPYTCFQGYSDPTPLGRGWGWVIPLGRGWGWVIPLGRGRGWVLSLGQEGVGSQIALAEVLAACWQLMVHQRGQLLLQQEEQPFARLVAVGVHVVFS